jgi:lysophospholipase L1-like esterase
VRRPSVKRASGLRLGYVLLFVTPFLMAAFLVFMEPMRASLAAVDLPVEPPAASIKPLMAWREVFQSSPANYVGFSLETEARLSEKFKLPPSLLEQMRPQPPVSGTLRFRFAVTAGGTQLRIRLSNEGRQEPLVLAGASVGPAAEGFTVEPGSLHPLTFAGKGNITIPPGAVVLSDPIALAVGAGSELMASIFLPGGYQLYPLGGATIAVAPGDQTTRDVLDDARPMYGRPVITGAEVLSTRPPQVIVALGDSITDGTRGNPKELRGWPEELARRLAAHTSGQSYAVVNAGIGGNRLLSPGSGDSVLARLDRDVLRIAGVSHIIVLVGTNDIGMSGHSVFGDNPPVTAEDMIAGYRQIIARAHGRDIKVVLGTITPFGGSLTHSTLENEDVRQAVNAWIRTSEEADVVIDFDRIVRDPVLPLTLRGEYNLGDQLHPNEAGHKAMGAAIDLSIFTGPEGARAVEIPECNCRPPQGVSARF